MSEMKFNTDLSRRRIEQIQNLLRREDCSVQEIADGIFIAKRWAYSYVNHLHENKRIHIASYRKSVRPNKAWTFIPLYCWGEAKDAKRPAKMSQAEYKKRYRKNIETGDDIREREMMKKRAKRLVPVRDWTAAWIPTKETA